MVNGQTPSSTDPHDYPEVYLLGAPKCGTTTIASWLAAHSAVHSSPTKEPLHFYSPYGTSMTTEAYLGLYSPERTGGLLRFDASVWNLYAEHAVAGILAVRPDARFIVCLRNPADMAVSLHSQKLAIGHEKLNKFSDAWAASSRRAQGERVGIFGIGNCDPRHMDYRTVCSIGTQVRRLNTQVERSRVLYLSLDSLAADPEATWEQLCSHLDLANEPIELRAQNVRTSTHRSQLVVRTVKRLGAARTKLGISRGFGVASLVEKLNSRDGSYGSPDRDLAEELRTFFSEETSILAAETGLEFS